MTNYDITNELFDSIDERIIRIDHEAMAIVETVSQGLDAFLEECDDRFDQFDLDSLKSDNEFLYALSHSGICAAGNIELTAEGLYDLGEEYECEFLKDLAEGLLPVVEQFDS